MRMPAVVRFGARAPVDPYRSGAEIAHKLRRAHCGISQVGDADASVHTLHGTPLFHEAMPRQMVRAGFRNCRDISSLSVTSPKISLAHRPPRLLTKLSDHGSGG